MRVFEAWDNMEQEIDEARLYWSERFEEPVDTMPWQVVFLEDPQKEMFTTLPDDEEHLLVS